ncbi:MAG: helix-turn-helix domain-containing protein [Gammaproteobacteria bacterium]
MNKNILTEKEASEYIGMSRSYLRQDRMNGIRENRTPGPRYLKIGRNIRYVKEDLDAWLLKHRVDRINDQVPIFES